MNCPTDRDRGAGVPGRVKRYANITDAGILHD